MSCRRGGREREGGTERTRLLLSQEGLSFLGGRRATERQEREETGPSECRARHGGGLVAGGVFWVGAR